MVSAQRPSWFPQRPMRLSMKVSLVVAGGLLLVLLVMNEPLKTTAAPQGMMSFQFAGDVVQANAILQSWRNGSLALAEMSLWIDFLFILAYVAALLQLTRHFTRDRPGIRERKVARWVRTLFVVAGASDIAENIVLMNNLDPATSTLSLTATLLALIKFTGLMLGIAGLVVIRAARRHPLTPAS